MALTQEQIEQYKTKGYVLGGVVLDEGEVEALRSEMDRVIRDQDHLLKKPIWIINLTGKAEAPVWQIVNICDASDEFMKLVNNPQIVEMAARLSEATELRLWHDQIQYKPAQTGGVNMWHQDSPYWPNLTPKEAQITAWVALDDVDESNGCMSMVPGSQTWGDQIEYIHKNISDFHQLPETFNGQALHAVTCPVKKGGVHFHHPLTWHGSQANVSGRPRRAIALHYLTQNSCYTGKGDHPMKQFIKTGVGEKIVGDHFPQVWPRK